MSGPLGALLGQELAWSGLADNPAHRSSIKMALSKAKYVYNILFEERKWVGEKDKEQA